MDKKIKATLRYASTPPTESQLASIKQLIAEKLDNPDVKLKVINDPEVGGGFIVSCGGLEYDWSDKGRARQLRYELGSVHSKDIIPMLKQKVEDFDLSIKGREVGVVTWIGDGIANVEGIEHAFYGEIIEFEDGTKGMAQDIRDDHIGCILFGDERGIRQGSRAVRTYKEAGVPVGEAFIGRVIDSLGAPIDGKGDIKESGYRAVEERSPGIVERQSVNEPMATGILSIDTMFPIGRGQRELIIGDRQTGKTSIALDTIINQKGKGVICIYVAIGQKASTVAQLITTLKKTGAMKYTIVVSSTASDPAPLQYIAPYSGTALAEYFMYKGKDVLIVYDDLSKHAVAYRALSLLLERPPGREAYPGDVFYLHSRLLERSSKLSDDLGGGSITALPIIETQAGDVSAYIPTNVISITDGQIFLDTDLFNQGNRPAINVGISVSRVGGNAQIKPMKKVAGTLKIDQAQYQELEAFTKFGGEMDKVTAMAIDKGRKNTRLLIQPQYSPMSVEEQVAILYCGTHGLFKDIDISQVQEFENIFLNSLRLNHQEDVLDLLSKGEFNDEITSKIEKIAQMTINQLTA